MGLVRVDVDPEEVPELKVWRFLVAVRAGLGGPAREIIVEPIKLPDKKPVQTPAPKEPVKV